MMNTRIFAAALLSLSFSAAMAASPVNFTTASEMDSPYAASNAQVKKAAISVEQVEQGSLNQKENNPLFHYTGSVTPSDVHVANNPLHVNH